MVTKGEAVNVRVMRVGCSYAEVASGQNGTLFYDTNEGCVVCEVRPQPCQHPQP